MSQLLPLGAIFTFHARRDPDRPMITFADETMTRGEIEARANRRARMLAAKGVGQGDFVTIALPNGLEFVETCIALWKLGATPQPVSSSLPAAELRGIVDLVCPKLVIEHGMALDESFPVDPLPPIECNYWRAGASGGSTGTRSRGIPAATRSNAGASSCSSSCPAWTTTGRCSSSGTRRSA